MLKPFLALPFLLWQFSPFHLVATLRKGRRCNGRTFLLLPQERREGE
jgi:hypothetical protein